MPYCPKCDMEFIDGITVCSDCHGPLVESREVANAMKKKEQEDTLMQMQKEYEKQMQMIRELKETSENTPESEPGEKTGRVPEFTHTYVSKSQKYDDLKSSASAFFVVGGILTIFSILCWLDILHLPFGLISRLSVTALGLISLIIAVKTTMYAKTIHGQIGEEETKKQQLINWFTDNHSGTRLDEQLLAEYGELTPEELSLKRFDLIQDILITSHDLSDQSYVDLLAEDIYGKLYQD